MVKQKKVVKDVLKWRKKKWVDILAPKEFNSANLGQSLVMTPSTLVGKTVESNLMTLTGDIKRQNINVKFMVTGISEGKANTAIISYKFAPSAVKRFIRRGRDRIDNSFICPSKDGVKIRVKPMIVTKSNASGSVLSMIRKKTQFLLSKYVESIEYSVFMQDVVNNKIQNELKNQLNDIYPLRTCIIRVVDIVKVK